MPGPGSYARLQALAAMPDVHRGATGRLSEFVFALRNLPKCNRITLIAPQPKGKAKADQWGAEVTQFESENRRVLQG